MPTLRLSAGEPAPWFTAVLASDHRKSVSFHELAGRPMVLAVFGSTTQPGVAELLARLASHDEVFDGESAILVTAGNDPRDFADSSLPQIAGQVRLWDQNATAARVFGVLENPSNGDAPEFNTQVFVLSPALQIVDVVPLDNPGPAVDRVLSSLATIPRAKADTQVTPVLVVPNVFDVAFCRRLIELFDEAGGREIGAIENQGKMVQRFDPAFRQRRDWYVEDKAALDLCKLQLGRRLLPMVHRAFQFSTSRIERYLVGCYDAETGGHFGSHRDNVEPPVAHRRFALTINLNENYGGGYLRFPEFGPRQFRGATGEAIVFSCSLLHEVTPITRDRRYAFISFLYDEAGQRQRDEYARRAAQSPAA